MQNIDNTRRFTDRADFYVRSRPKYPPAVLDFCRDRLGLRPQVAIADIGSGTGILTELFLRNGNTVFAVEPNEKMRHAAERLLGNFAAFHSVAATAESTGLPQASVHFVLAGQAFHWFDPPRARAEFARILVPGGWIALVWNERRQSREGFMGEYEAIIAEFKTEDRAEHHREITGEGSVVLKNFFAPAEYAVASFDHMQELDLPGLQDRVVSSSHMPLPSHPRHGQMLDRLADAFARHAVGGLVRLEYDTRIYYGKLEPTSCLSR